MNRAPIVLTATGAGLAALLSFHTTSLSGALAPLVSAAGAGSGTGSSGTGSSGTTTTPPTSTTAGGKSAPTTAAGAGAAARPGPSTTVPGPPPTSGPPAPASPASAPATTPPTTASPTTTTTSGTRRANGSDVQYRYGELELQVTISGGQITDVQPVIDNAADQRSAQINSQAEPQLRQQALQAQSSNINGVSGATYTSNAFVQSLQAALNKLGWTH